MRDFTPMPFALLLAIPLTLGIVWLDGNLEAKPRQSRSDDRLEKMEREISELRQEIAALRKLLEAANKPYIPAYRRDPEYTKKQEAMRPKPGKVSEEDKNFFVH